METAGGPTNLGLTINEKVKEFITNIYNNKRHETIKIYELLCTDDEKALLEGY
jgi:hypothetical protein